MSDPFKEFVEQIARLAVPEDDTEESRGRREAASASYARLRTSQWRLIYVNARMRFFAVL
jgi:hypothetical protein